MIREGRARGRDGQNLSCCPTYIQGDPTIYNRKGILWSIKGTVHNDAGATGGTGDCPGKLGCMDCLLLTRGISLIPKNPLHLDLMTCL